MPEIPILFGRGKMLDSPTAFLLVQGIMLFPKNTPSVETLVKFSHVPDSELLRACLSHSTRGATGGAIAGEVFLHLLGLKLHQIKGASISKAVFLVSRDLEDKALYSGKAAPSNIDRIHKFWTDFRPAAHLWAAFRLEQEADRVPKTTEPSDAELASFTDHLLLSADVFLKVAAEVDLSFDPDPWRVPDHYPRKPWDIQVPPPTAWVLETLKLYRAPVRPK